MVCSKKQRRQLLSSVFSGINWNVWPRKVRWTFQVLWHSWTNIYIYIYIYGCTKPAFTFYYFSIRLTVGIVRLAWSYCSSMAMLWQGTSQDILFSAKQHCHVRKNRPLVVIIKSSEWLWKLPFFASLIKQMNDLNTKLQGETTLTLHVTCV